MKIYIKKGYTSLYHKPKYVELKRAKLIRVYKKHPNNLYLIEHNGYRECYYETDIKIEEG